MKNTMCVDLLQVLQHCDKQKLTNVTLYGRVEEEIAIPTRICSRWQQYYNAVAFRVYLIDFGTHTQELKSAGFSNEYNKYFVNGTVGLYVEDYDITEFYTCTTHLRLYPDLGDPCFVAGFRYLMEDNVWWITDNKLSVLNTKQFENTPMQAVFGGMGIPEYVTQYPEFHADLRGTAQEDGLRDFKGKVSKVQSEIVDERATELSKMPFVASYSDRSSALASNALSSVEDQYSKAENGLRGFIAQIQQRCPMTEDSVAKSKDIVLSILSLCAQNLNTVTVANAFTGREVIEKYVGLWGKYKTTKYAGKRLSTYIVRNLDDILRYLRGYSVYSIQGLEIERYILDLFGTASVAYACFVQVFTGVPTRLIDTLLKKDDISLLSVLETNPYLLSLSGYCSVYDAMDLAVYFGTVSEDGFLTSLIPCYIYDYMNRDGGNSTVFDLDALMTNTPLCLAVSTQRYMSNYTERRMASMQLYLQHTSLVYPFDKYGFVHNKGYWEKRLSAMECKPSIQQLINCGLITYFSRTESIPSLCACTRTLGKELYIYRSIQSKLIRPVSVDVSLIDTYIAEYEAICGFALESKQKQAIRLLTQSVGVISGAAGSGKTTAVGGLVYVLRKLNPSVEIVYAAPTGKAAKVLQKVVKEPASTLHSICKIGVGQESLQEEIEHEVVDSPLSNSVFIIDETSMVTVDLLYRVLKTIGQARIYFIGDIYQLPPIGKGAVLRDLLLYAPCVFLEVTKRASEDSNITYNSNIINKFSDKSSWKPLKNGEDFVRIECDDKEIQKNTVVLCNNLISEGVSPSDIQVVSPVVTDKYSWGANSLNKVLQPVFNKGQNDFMSINKTVYSVGDRVIHTKKNCYSMAWYEQVDYNWYKVLNKAGVSNGEVGELVGFVSTTDIRIEYDDVFPEGQFVRDDREHNGYFIVVRYRDYVEDKDFYILYQAYQSKEDVTNLYGGDTGLLDLFYCGSVHKMQGSQSPYIIGCIGNRIGRESFITRNMLYTLVTRASERVYLVGSVSDVEQSRVSVGRGLTEADTTQTCVSMLLHRNER